MGEGFLSHFQIKYKKGDKGTQGLPPKGLILFSVVVLLKGERVRNRNRIAYPDAIALETIYHGSFDYFTNAKTPEE